MSADLLDFHLRAEKITFEREFRFHSTRKWRADFRIGKVLVEVDGGLFINGRHSRGKGREADFCKLNEAVLLGYSVLQFSTGQVKRGEAIATIKRFSQSQSGFETCGDGAGLPPKAATPLLGDPSVLT